jgi:branched-chain amino acid transport system ATP-binding protein
VLAVRGLSKRFAGVEAVADLSFDVPEGITGLIGPNGAGKTTVFNLITGFLRPDAGTVSLDGRRLDGLPPHEICRLGVARTFQITRPFPELTVLRNVATAALLRCAGTAAAERTAVAVLEQVELVDKAERLAGELGVADRKRLELARALATRPRLLLLDEVFSGLNPTETDHLVHIVRRLHDRGVAILLVEHVLRVVMQLCARVIVIDRGRRIAMGTPAEVVADPATIAAYLGGPADKASATAAPEGGVGDERGAAGRPG